MIDLERDAHVAFAEKMVDITNQRASNLAIGAGVIGWLATRVVADPKLEGALLAYLNECGHDLDPLDTGTLLSECASEVDAMAEREYAIADGLDRRTL
jgi:hypothetical protein